MIPGIFWIIAGVLLVLSELIATSAIAVFFGVAAIAVGLLSEFGLIDSATLQFVLFTVASAALWISAKKYVVKWLKLTPGRDSDPAHFVSDTIGDRAVAVEDFDRRGRVSLNGAHWDAMTDTPVKAGEEVRVLRNENITLIVEPLSTKP